MDQSIDDRMLTRLLEERNRRGGRAFYAVYGGTETIWTYLLVDGPGGWTFMKGLASDMTVLNENVDSDTLELVNE